MLYAPCYNSPPTPLLFWYLLVETALHEREGRYDVAIFFMAIIFNKPFATAGFCRVGCNTTLQKQEPV